MSASKWPPGDCSTYIPYCYNTAGALHITAVGFHGLWALPSDNPTAHVCNQKEWYLNLQWKSHLTTSIVHVEVQREMVMLQTKFALGKIINKDVFDRDSWVSMPANTRSPCERLQP